MAAPIRQLLVAASPAILNQEDRTGLVALADEITARGDLTRALSGKPFECGGIGLRKLGISLQAQRQNNHHLLDVPSYRALARGPSTHVMNTPILTLYDSMMQDSNPCLNS
ncbi:MAG TPA: hypothetical protein VF628_00860 [Allosphingosinicella sp.]